MYRRFCSPMVPEINIPTLLQRSSTTATSKVISNNPLSPNTSLMLLLFFSLLLNLVLLFNLFTAPVNSVDKGRGSFLFPLWKFFFFLLSTRDEWKKQVSLQCISMARAWTPSSNLQVHGFRHPYPTWSPLYYQKKLPWLFSLFKVLPSPTSSTW